MLTSKKLTIGAAGVLSALLLSPMARAATYSDAGAAVVVFPKIVVDGSTDTVVQLANQSTAPAAAHCFYVNANSRCTNSGEVCSGLDASECFDPSSGFTGACLPGWIEINFDVFLTPGQPLAWSAEEGLDNDSPRGLEFFHVPCPGGLGGSCGGFTNAGTRVPPVGENPFIGELKCVQTDPITRLPAECSTVCGTTPTAGCCRQDLIGSATIESVLPLNVVKIVVPVLDAARYNAVGLRSTGFNDGDNLLVIGGSDDPEYQPCPGVLVFNHLFDNAVDPISGVFIASTELSLVPCTEDLLVQRVPQVTAQFLVYNEFEQRFSTSRLVNCLLDSPISLIDTSQPDRSIFNAGVAGTVAGQTRITGVNGGLLGAGVLKYCDPEGCDNFLVEALSLPPAGAGYNLSQFADREEADFIRLP